MWMIRKKTGSRCTTVRVTCQMPSFDEKEVDPSSVKVCFSHSNAVKRRWTGFGDIRGEAEGMHKLREPRETMNHEACRELRRSTAEENRVSCGGDHRRSADGDFLALTSGR